MHLKVHLGFFQTIYDDLKSLEMCLWFYVLSMENPISNVHQLEVNLAFQHFLLLHLKEARQ